MDGDAKATGRIVCIGSRLVAEDQVGPAVCDRLRAGTLPSGVEVIDGGVRGLDLLPFLEGVRRVVLVDAVRGYAAPGVVTVLPASRLEQVSTDGYDHAGGLVYLLKSLPHVLSHVPEIVLLGIEIPAGAEALDEAAAMALELCGASRGATSVVAGAEA